MDNDIYSETFEYFLCNGCNKKNYIQFKQKLNLPARMVSMYCWYCSEEAKIAVGANYNVIHLDLL